MLKGFLTINKSYQERKASKNVMMIKKSYKERIGFDKVMIDDDQLWMIMRVLMMIN